MLDRLDNADTKVTLLLKSATAKYIRTASAGQDKTQSKFVSDVLERYGTVESLDMKNLRALVSEMVYDDVNEPLTPLEILEDKVGRYVSQILSIFGIEEVQDGVIRK